MRGSLYGPVSLLSWDFGSQRRWLDGFISMRLQLSVLMLLFHMGCPSVLFFILTIYNKRDMYGGNDTVNSNSNTTYLTSMRRQEESYMSNLQS